ncbi:glycoside hydrolase family 2 protein [Ruania halotolerans]|uniref:glycoside hydrolase family 2 protein n=1 Tax=Ruania halotolerans TaxID=2897773 RepID=UPI001E296A05|nr:glycoside hydrolase family 2 TIM barrel-domain containing protein [Ruania halotolerans]UFU05470.1 glycoside hydrolase family 2 protein [Ruania halotolerans]
MESTPLHTGWQLRSAGPAVPAQIREAVVPATVPGSVHTDLLDAGLIPDPYLGENESALTWMHRADWVYETSFAAEPLDVGDRAALVFEGLDTVATITLNGTVIGQTENMHRRYRFDVTGLLAEENSLTVSFTAALTRAEEIAREVGARPHSYDHPFNAIRKMACSFGWDWGPDLQTAGIWKPVHLERWHAARLDQVRPLVTVGGDGHGRVEVLVDVTTAEPRSTHWVRAALTSPDGAAPVAQGEVTVADGRAAVVLDVPDAQLWWPHGYGAQPRYCLEVSLIDGETTRDSWERMVAFREVVVRAEPDEAGTSFVIEINGTPVFVKGANWIPDDHLLTRITAEQYARRVDQSVAANINLLRVWGGGIYEQDEFYDACDERGVLVWQDFLLACAAYAEEEPLRGEFEAEARDNVLRLMSHPSLVLWCGGNENLWFSVDHEWDAQLAGGTWGYGYYHDVFARVVSEIDPTRAYIEGSPASPGFAPWEKHPNDPDHGLKHEWQVWNRVDYSHYRDEAPRFVSEFGFQGPPTWATLTRALEPEDLHKESPAFLLHQKAPDGNGKLDRGMRPHLGVPGDFTDWHWAAQLNQAHAVRFAVEHYRSHWPRTAGAIVWQINDCWPVTSWAAIDGDERPKPLWYAMRQAYAPRLLTVQPREKGLVVAIANDTDAPWDGVLHLARERLDGSVCTADETSVHAAPRSVTLVDVPDELAIPGDPAREVLFATLGENRAVHLFAENKDVALAPDALTASVEQVRGGYGVHVHAASLALDVTVLADRLAPDARADRALDTLRAGETITIRVRTEHEVEPDLLTASPILRSSNDLHGAVVR